MKGWVALAPRMLLAALSGLGMVLVCPPIGLRHLLWFVFVPMFLSLRSGSHRQNMLMGYVAGWVMLFANFVWLADTVVTFSSLPYAASLLVVVAFASFFGLPYAVVFGLARWLRERLGLGWLLVVPALQVANEALSPALFPYTLGATLYRDPYIWQLASVLGGSSLSFLALLCNALLAETIWRLQEQRAPSAPPPLPPRRASGLAMAWWAVAAMLAGVVAFGAWRVKQVEAVLTEAPTLRVSLLQQTGDMEYWLGQSAWEMLSAWIILTRKIQAEEPDLVVWPEGSVLINPDDDREYRALGGKSPRDFFGGMAAQGGYDLLIGGGTIELLEGTTADGRQRFTAYNSCYKFDRSGNLGGRYDKMVPLPFGEYLPLSDVFPILRELIQGPGDFRAGREVVRFSASSRRGSVQYDFSTPICYEAILGAQMWKMRGVDLLVNITNDAWFGDTAAPHLHAMLAAVRAMELGRPLLRVAYTGIGMVVEPHGQILYETDPFQEVARVETLRLGQVQTLYARGGFVFPWLTGLLGVGALGWAWQQQRQNSRG